MTWIWCAVRIRWAVLCRQAEQGLQFNPCILALVQVVEEGYEFFAKRQLVTIFSAPNYCGEFENAGAMMSVDETLMCSFQVSNLLLRSWSLSLTWPLSPPQILKPAEKGKAAGAKR
jgi:hypothetical protein